MGHGQETRLTLFCKSCLRMYLDAPAQTLQISGKQRKGRRVLSQQRTTIQHSPRPRRRQRSALKLPLSLSKHSQRRGCPAAFLTTPGLREAHPVPRRGLGAKPRHQ